MRFLKFCSTCTNRNSLNFCHMKVILDFLEPSRCPLQLCLSKLKSKMPHLRDMSQNFTGHFESQQKDIFCQSNLHQDEDFK